MKKNIAVIFGGKSTEHDVSIITAHSPIIQSLLTKNEYEVWPIYISKDSSWYSDQAMNKLEYFQDQNLINKLANTKKINISLNNGFEIIWPGFIKKSVKIDVVFPAMHGTYGEDGSLMGMLRMANVPFVGCDMFASAVAMDKVFTKEVLFAEEIPVVPYVWFIKDEWENNSDKLKNKISNLNYPLFVKPVHLGSSIGISKVKQISELNNAIEFAFHYDNKILVEESIENLIEVTLPIIGNEELQLANVERALNKTAFFDFKDKYLSGGKKGDVVNNQYSEIPANIEDVLINKVQDFGRKTYKILGCSGIARVDFLINEKSKKVYVNEVNTLPGSLYCHNWKKLGISNVELVTKLIKMAEDRFNSQKETNYVFDSEILKHVSGPKLG